MQMNAWPPEKPNSPPQEWEGKLLVPYIFDKADDLYRMAWLDLKTVIPSVCAGVQPNEVLYFKDGCFDGSSQFTFAGNTLKVTALQADGDMECSGKALFHDQLVVMNTLEVHKDLSQLQGSVQASTILPTFHAGSKIGDQTMPYSNVWATNRFVVKLPGLQSDIRPLEHGLDFISKLETCKRREGENPWTYEVTPESIIDALEGESAHVAAKHEESFCTNMDSLVAILLNAVRELESQVAALESQ